MNEKLSQPTSYHEAVAMKSPEHLKQWLEVTGRQWLVLKTVDIVDSLPWPEGVTSLMQVLEAYRQHRITIPVDFAPCPRLAQHGTGTCTLCSNKKTVIVRSKSDKLEFDELKEACVWLLNQIREKDQSWNPFIPCAVSLISRKPL